MELNEWLLENIKEGQVVGVDPELISFSAARALEKKLLSKNIRLVPVSNIVDSIWTSRPTPSTDPVLIHREEYAGESVHSKIQKVQDKIKTAGVDAFVVSMLDEVSLLQ